MTTELDLTDLWLDANHGRGKRDQAFGYIGTDEEYEDEDGDDQEFCGWFFDWPGSKASITSEAGRQEVLDSLSADETMEHLEKIPKELAYEKLEAYLAKKFPAFGEEE